MKLIELNFKKAASISSYIYTRMKLLNNFTKIIKKIVGLTRIADQVQKLSNELHVQKQLLNRAVSYLEFSTIDYHRMNASNKYINSKKIIHLLSPMDILSAKYRRIGRDYDGGYVMLDDFSARSIDAAYSFGISNDVSWDEDIANLGIDVYMYDHTIQDLPKKHPLFHFFKIGVTGIDTEGDLKTLNTLIADNGHQQCKNLILKMDIEGNEWSVIEETPSNVLNQFAQIVIEFHGIDPSESPQNISRITAALEKLNQTHQAIHIHANSYCDISYLGELVLPNLLEVTYVRRLDYGDRFTTCTRTFPTEYDRSTYHWLPDVFLAKFSANDDNTSK
jgi:hypothetical protein